MIEFDIVWLSHALVSKIDGGVNFRSAKFEDHMIGLDLRTLRFHARWRPFGDGHELLNGGLNAGLKHVIKRGRRAKNGD